MGNTRCNKKENKPVDEVMDVIETVEEVNEQIDTVKTDDTPEVQTNKKGVVDNCSNLNVRKDASKESEVLCTISKGTNVEIFNDEDPVWYNVRTSDIDNGYCMKKFIIIID